MSYETIKAQLSRGHRTLDKNTKLFLARDSHTNTELVRMFHQGRHIANFRPNKITLHAQGHRSQATRRRLNLALSMMDCPFRVLQEGLFWYTCPYVNGLFIYTQQVRFYDHLTLVMEE